MKTKDTGEFIRYGNLSPQIHKIPKNPEDRSYHTAPVEKGFYAFPRGFIETFLLGGSGSGSLQNGRFRKLRDSNGKPIKIAYDDLKDFIDNYPIRKIRKKLYYAKPDPDEFDKDDGTFETYDDYENYWRENGPYEIWVENNPTRFTYKGLIWHHLFNSENPIKDKEYHNFIKIVDSWVLTDMKTYLRCLKSTVGEDKYSSAFKDWYGVNKGERQKRKMESYFNYGGKPYPYSKDHFEVYIESIQNER